MPKNLPILSVESIIPYIDPEKRLLLSLTYPRFSKIEKRLPLELPSIDIRTFGIRLRENRIIIEDGEIIFINQKEFRGRKRRSKWRVCEDDVLEVVSALFSGRTNLRVEKFESEIQIPFDLNIDASKVLVRPDFQSVIKCCGNVFRKVDCVWFWGIRFPDDLRHSWIQNSERLDILHGNSAPLIAELPNLRAKTIHIRLEHSLENGFALIKTWIQNRKTEEEAAIYITFADVPGADQLFHFHALREMGFTVLEENRLLGLPVGNNLEARLTLRDDKEHFHGSGWNQPQYDYLGVKIIDPNLFFFKSPFSARIFL